MSIVLTRLDDRLIHGQVVVGWVQHLGVRRIVLIDDEVRSNSWEQELYTLGVPGDVTVEFASVPEAVAAVREWNAEPTKTILLAGRVDTIVRLCEGTDVIRKINVGGLHEGGERTQRLAFVYLTVDEAEQLRRLREQGVEVTAQDVPTTSPVPLESWA